MRKRLALFFKWGNEPVELIKFFRGEIDAAAGGRTEFQRGIMGMFGAVEKEIIVIVRGKDQMASNFPGNRGRVLAKFVSNFLKLHPFSMPASIEILSESVKCLPLLDSIKVFINRNSFHVGA